MTAVIGIIGGSGLGDALRREIDGVEHEVETPFGRPSAAIVRGRWEGAEIAFLSRHGEGHTIPPSAVPYRANVYALKALGVEMILASGAVGSLREELCPGDLVVPDQVIDRTHRRASSFFEETGLAVHVEFGEPFCPALRRILLDAGGGLQGRVHDGGTYVCMEGPAFSTAAESRMHRGWGGDLIGMTCLPEARLAREAELCYALAALPTDYDSWRPRAAGVDPDRLLEEILTNMRAATAAGVGMIRAALRRLAEAPPADCACRHALRQAIWTRPEHQPPDAARRYGILLSKYSRHP